MAGGLMQLVAYGAQDVYLTGNPKVTFFQAVYKRHTNFAMEMIEQVVNGTVANDGRLSVTIARNGDLIGNMFIEMQPEDSVLGSLAVPGDAWCAERAIKDVELTIGGQRIDKHYQRWWRLYAELYLNDAKKGEWGKLTTKECNVNGSAVMLPLIFFFNRNPGLFLPLIALQYHEVRLDFDLSSEYTTYLKTSGLKVWGNYVYLDTEERRRFAQKGHEYLIEQVQHTGADTVDTGTKTVRLSYNHPVKELVWCINQTKASGAASQANELWNFGCSSANATVTSNLFIGQASHGSNAFVQPHLCGAPFLSISERATTCQFIESADVCTTANVATTALKTFKLILNGQDRFKEQTGRYFNQYQPMQYHSGNPMPGIYCYSFGLKPEEHQPTGTCNFSRIDNAQVALTAKTLAPVQAGAGLMSMFAVNYNVLRIQSGMGGLAFSN